VVLFGHSEDELQVVLQSQFSRWKSDYWAI